MTVAPSCPVLVVHDDDVFRKSLIAELDQRHFTVTFAPDGDEAVRLLGERKFRVVLVGLDLARQKGTTVLERLRETRDKNCGVIILGDPHPEVRKAAPWADETLLKPVDASWVATRAQQYCNCG